MFRVFIHELSISTVVIYENISSKTPNDKVFSEKKNPLYACQDFMHRMLGTGDETSLEQTS